MIALFFFFAHREVLLHTFGECHYVGEFVTSPSRCVEKNAPNVYVIFPITPEIVSIVIFVVHQGNQESNRMTPESNDDTSSPKLVRCPRVKDFKIWGIYDVQT